MEGSAPAIEASRLLHHLLNQSLSGLDFCILWQDLVKAHRELDTVDGWVRKFLESADLSALDRALAILPEPAEGEPLPPVEVPEAAWGDGWSVRSVRVRDVTRAEFCCQRCGFEIDFALEHPPNTEMRLPLENLNCPICDENGQAC